VLRDLYGGNGQSIRRYGHPFVTITAAHVPVNVRRLGAGRIGCRDDQLGGRNNGFILIFVEEGRHSGPAVSCAHAAGMANEAVSFNRAMHNV
jgi:hypothetical protein